MWSTSAVPLLLLLVSAAEGASFVPPSTGPVTASSNYGNPSTGPIASSPIVPGAAFDRIVTIFLENTDFATANSDSFMQSLAAKGVLLNNYFGVTHPSQPNYIAHVGGDFFGLPDDSPRTIPSNIATVVDLLDAKSISWATYAESMHADGDTATSETLPNYGTGGANPYPYYMRKHNPLIDYTSVTGVSSRSALIRNFNDFVADFNAGVLPQWMFITPNMVDDGHDTSQSWIDGWLNFWLVPLLNDSNFNSDRTLVVLTYDENETQSENNNVYALLLGNAVPTALRGTTDSTYFTHYSLLSTVENNWGLGCLGRQDTNKTMANVFSFVATATGYTNQDVTDIPNTSITGSIPGPLNPKHTTAWPAANTNAVCPGGGSVFVG